MFQRKEVETKENLKTVAGLNLIPFPVWNFKKKNSLNQFQ